MPLRWLHVCSSWLACRAQQVLPLPDELLMKHAALYEDYKNTTHWPKHVLVHYRWHDEGDVDFNKGLYVLLATGG